MGLLIQLSDLKTYLQIGYTTDDVLLTQIITNVSAAIEADCQRSFSAVLSYADLLDGGVNALVLRNRPVVEVMSVADLMLAASAEQYGFGSGATGPYTHTAQQIPLVPSSIAIGADSLAITDDGNGNLVAGGVNVGTVNYTTGAMSFTAPAPIPAGTQILCGYTPASAIVPSPLYQLDAQEGLIRALPQAPQNWPVPAGMFQFLGLTSVWGIGERRWSVSYTAGFSAVPADVQQAALIWCAGKYNRRDDLAMEAVGDYRYQTEKGDSGLTLEVEQLLSRHKEVVF
jgi:hypothetical protein